MSEKGGKKGIAQQMGEQQRDISVAEFFEKNRHLLGFDNKRKALLTTIKEAVDNSLDACEEAGIMPHLNIEVIEMGEERYRVVVEDNGPGIVKEHIPKVFAKLLYGSKFHKLKMSRGQQGIGISAAAMYGQLTTGRPIRITSKIAEEEKANYCELFIDTRKNEPEIVKEEIKSYPHEHGVRVELDLEGSYAKGDQSIDEYLKETAIVNPHVTIVYTNPKAEQRIFAAATDKMPPKAEEIKPHPHGIEVGILIKMMKNTTEKTIKQFFMKDFSRVTDGVATEILTIAVINPKTSPSEVTRTQADDLMKAIRKVNIMAPPTNCVIPIGAELLEKGLKKEIQAEFFTSCTRPPQVYRGNPFVIECAIGYGGSLPGDKQATVLRFANRVPLLYQQNACACTKAIVQTNWKAYGLSQSANALPFGPIVVVVHLASVWAPYTSEAKEAIAHYPEIIKEIKLALQQCGRELGIYLKKKHGVMHELQKRDFITKYIPFVGKALMELLSLNNTQELEIEDHLGVILAAKRGAMDEELVENVKKPKQGHQSSLIGATSRQESDDDERGDDNDNEEKDDKYSADETEGEE